MEFPEAVYFSIHTEVSPAYLNDLLVYIYQSYILPSSRNFTNVGRWTSDEREVLAFTFLEPSGRWHIDIEMRMGVPIEVRMTPSSGEVPQTVLNRIKEDLIIGVQLFKEKIRRTTLYFAWVPHKGIEPEKILPKKRAFSNIFLGNMIILFLIFITFNFLMIFFFPLYTPVIVVVVQLFIVIFLADKFVMRMGDWMIDEENPYVHILQYHIPAEEFQDFNQKYTRDNLLQMKMEIYQRTLALGKPVDFQTAQEVFSKYGIQCRPEYLSTKTMNVYHLVKKATEEFNLPVPKITISNVIIPNAGATGPSPSRGLVLITTGLLVQLEEDEVLAVVGHEVSHLKNRDTLALATLVSAEYLLRVYVFLPFILFFGFLYYFFVYSVIYFIYKFFEARADLESSIKIGRPGVLAGALRKIGFRKIWFERTPSNRIGSWIGWDPHPPISFRVARLESLKEPSKIKHIFIRSIKDCINGLLAELRF